MFKCKYLIKYYNRNQHDKTRYVIKNDLYQKDDDAYNYAAKLL